MANALSDIDFRFYLALFRRRLPLFLTVVLLAGAIGIALTLLWPPSYRATAKILVESPQIPTDLAKSTVPTNAAEQFQIIQEDVLSRASVLALIDRWAIYAGTRSMSQSDMLDDMKRRLEIVPIPVATGGGGAAATVFHISFKANQPDTAANVVNDLVTRILDKDVQLRTVRATETVTFFTKETRRLDALLRELDSRILAFKNEHINAMPDSIDFRRHQQTAQQQRLLVLAQEEAMLRKRQTDLQVRPFEINAAPVTLEEQSLHALRQSLTQQQALFSEESPTIKALRSRIAALESIIIGPTIGKTTEPLSTRDFELADIGDRIAAIAGERARIDQTVSNLAASIAATPSNETMLNSLQRDHQNLQAQYDAAIARLAEASTGQQIELLFKGERLSLIESAVPPQVPEGPSQKVLLLASVVGALMVGLAAIVAPEFLNRYIRRPSELVARLQIVPFITVPYIERKTHRPARLVMRLSMILAVPMLLLAAETYVAPVKDLVSQARASLASTISRL